MKKEELSPINVRGLKDKKEEGENSFLVSTNHYFSKGKKTYSYQSKRGETHGYLFQQGRKIHELYF